MSYNLTELKTAIQDYTENSETTFVNNLDNIIQNAEQRILRLVDLDFFRKNVSASTLANSKYIAAPVDFLSSFSLAITDSSGNSQFLLQKDVNFLQEYCLTQAKQDFLNITEILMLIILSLLQLQTLHIQLSFIIFIGQHP
jgi:hypothetical protein